MYLFLSLKWWQSSILWSVRCRFHLLYHCSHLLSLIAIRCHSFSLFVTRCTTCCHSLSLVEPLIVIRCHSLYHLLPFVVPLFVTRCHSLSLVLPLVVTHCYSLSLVVPLVVTRCTTRLSFYERSDPQAWLGLPFHSYPHCFNDVKGMQIFCKNPESDFFVN